MSRILDTAQLLKSRRTGVAVAACLATAALVAGCGGGSRVKAFQPTQIIAFGDENSAFDDTTAAPLVSSRLVQFDASTAVVPYAARYTINLVADAQFRCKNAMPDKTEKAGCATTNVPTSVLLGASDYPTVNSFFVPDPTLTVYGYRLQSNIPIVNQVETGAFNDASPVTTIYSTTDHIYYCSMGFGTDNGNWVQRVAYGLGGEALSVGTAGGGCAQDSGNGRSYAQWGANVDKVATQVNTNIGSLHDGVLVTMFAGQNDIMAAYASVQSSPPTSTEDAAMILMRNKGQQLADLITRIVATGARVVYLTVPDMGKAPGASANPTLATSLTKAFNEGYKGANEREETGGLVLSVLNDGHKIVKVDGYTSISNLSVSLAAPYSNTAACVADPSKVSMPNGTKIADAAISGSWTADTIAKALLLNCRSNNLYLTSGDLTATPPTNEVRAGYGSYLWADSLHLAPLGHANLANLAVSRIRDQL